MKQLILASLPSLFIVNQTARSAMPRSAANVGMMERQQDMPGQIAPSRTSRKHLVQPATRVVWAFAGIANAEFRRAVVPALSAAPRRSNPAKFKPEQITLQRPTLD
jgi:hypothetical protein